MTYLSNGRGYKLGRDCMGVAIHDVYSGDVKVGEILSHGRFGFIFMTRDADSGYRPKLEGILAIVKQLGCEVR